MIPKRNLKVSLVLAGLLAFSLLGPQLLPDTSQVQGQEAKSGGSPIRYVFSTDYPVGGKDKYIAWVKSIAEELTAPKELRRIASYDNYFGGSPNRVIDFEFDSMEDATRYFANEKIRAILADWTNYGVNMNVQVLILRSDYTAK